MIEIRITGTTPLEALASVTAFGMHCMKNQDVHAAATRVLETEEGKVSKSDTAPAPIPAPAVPPAAAPAPPGNAPAVAPVAAAPAYTVEQIGKAGADLVSQDAAKLPELLALLQKYGAQAITQLKPEQLGAFATELRGLGAKL